MTITEGYPDWQRVDSRALAPLFMQTFDTLGANTNKGPFFVGNFPLLLVKVLGSPNTSYDVQFVWYDDAAMTNQLFLKVISVNTDILNYTAPLRVLSPWLKITVIPVAYVAGSSVSVSITPSFNPMAAIEIEEQLQVMENNHSTAAGATTNVPFLQVIAGPFAFHWRVFGATVWTLALQDFDGGHVYANRYVVNNTGGVLQGFETISLPPRPMRVQFINGDAAARTWSCVVGSLMY